MALPKLNTPEYELLPSTGGKIKYRPFLVKEQKLLMLAQQKVTIKTKTNTTLRVLLIHVLMVN